jgi:hypothetical protein
MTQNHRVYGRDYSPELRITRKHNVSETVSVSVLRRGEKDTSLLGPLEGANLNHWIQRSETLRFTNIFLEFRAMDQVQILDVAESLRYFSIRQVAEAGLKIFTNGEEEERL